MWDDGDPNFTLNLALSALYKSWILIMSDYK